jgi:hypothetical protein
MQIRAYARIDLGLSLEELGRLTPRIFAEYRKRKERLIEDQEFLSAQIAAAVMNFSMTRPKKPVRPIELMPSMMRREAGRKETRPKRRTRAAIADEMRQVMREMMRRKNG